MADLILTTYDWVPEAPRGRLVDRFEGLKDYLATRAYAARATARPSFVKAHADQMAHFNAADLRNGSVASTH